MAMLMVIGTMVIVTIIAVATLAFATNAIPQTRHSEDYQIAGAAAQAGIDDFLGRLAVCSTYFEKPCTNSATDNTSDAYSSATPSKWLDGVSWVSVPDTSSGVAASGKYTYKLLSAKSGVIRMEFKGRSRNVTRVFTDDLSKSSLLNFIYFTDLEDLDPQLYYLSYPSFTNTSGTCPTPGKSQTCTTDVYENASTSGSQSIQSIRDNCGIQLDGTNPRYYYNGRNSAQWQWYYTETVVKVDSSGNKTTTTTTKSTPENCIEITFVSGDTINGPMHTNDAMRINGANFANKDTETSWSPTAPVQPATPGNLWWGTGPGSGSNKPIYVKPTVLPPNNASIEHQADPAYGGQGCLYTGPTKITLLSTGKLSVISPYTKSTNPGCSNGTLPITSAETVNGPANGVIYVQGIPASSGDPNYSASCSMTTETTALGYPNTSDQQATPAGSTADGLFGCADGTAFVSGPGMSGQYTIASAKDIYVTGNITYSNTNSGGDVLGLVANGFVYVYHPVSSSGTNLTGSMTSPTIDAAILSVNDSFVVENFDEGAQLGTLNINGGIYQRYRGAVGTSSGTCSGGTGYCKNYVYDTRLPFDNPPPSFLDPVSSAWRIANQAEQSSSNS